MQIVQIIEQMEELVNSGHRIPLAGGRSLVDAGHIRALIEKLRDGIPQDIKEAQEVLRQRERMVKEAAIAAERLQGSAEAELKARTSESSVVKAAERQAREIVARAEREAELLRADSESKAAARREEANKYAEEVLRRLETQVSALLTSIRKGISILEVDARK